MTCNCVKDIYQCEECNIEKEWEKLSTNKKMMLIEYYDKLNKDIFDYQHFLKLGENGLCISMIPKSVKE